MQNLPPNPVSSLDLQRKVDAICDAFEKRWENGEAPSVDDYCKFASGELRQRLFYELTIVEHQLAEKARRSRRFSTDSTRPNSSESNSTGSELTGSELAGSALVGPNETQLGALKTAKMAFPIPERVGRFEIRYELGRGSAGVVYAAIDSLDGSQVAVKVPHAYLISTQEGMGRFLSEAKHAQVLQHKNVVKLVYFGEDGPGPYLAYEFLNGVDLKTCLKLGVELPIDIKLEIIVQAARGLQRAHDQGVIHRDVSPGNIMITIPDGLDLYDALESRSVLVKVIDFGIARPVDAETLQTRTGAMMGTPAYMSPEQASGMSKEVDVRSDVYGLGAVMYHLLTGSLPFSGDVTSILNQRRNQEVPMLSSTHPGLPGPVSTICQRCLRLSPESRYRSMGHVVSDIESYLDGKPIQAKNVGFLERGLSRWKHSLAVRTVSGFVILLFACVAFSFYAASMLVSKSPQSIWEPVNLEPTATQQFVDRLPGASKDLELLAQSISTATPEELVELVEAMKSHSRSSSLNWNSIFDDMASNKSIEEKWNIREEKLDCIRCALDPEYFASLNHPQDLVRWITGLVDAENLEAWKSLTGAYENQFLTCLANCFDTETLLSTRNGIVVWLAHLHKNDLEKLVAYAVRSQPSELAVWSEMIQQCTNNPKESIPVQWQQFDEPNKAERFSENDCIEQANRVLLRLKLGDVACLRDALRQRTDPRLRTYVAHRFVAAGFGFNAVFQPLLAEQENDICYGLLLTMGLMDGSSIEASFKNRCKTWLLENYQHHPDSGVHAMCRSLLDRWQWTLDRKKIDEVLILSDSPGKSDKTWFVNSLGMNFAIVRGPIDFWMGQVAGPEKAYQFNPRKQERINESYAIAMEQVDLSILTQFKPDFTNQKFNWNQGVDFCRWLNQKEHYNDIDLTVLSDPDGIAELKDFVGYRLPTSAEWEFAAIGYASTSCHFGTIKTEHATSFRRSKENQMIPLPNRLGLAGLGDYSELTCTPFVHDPKLILHRSGQISFPGALRSETNVNPASRVGMSINSRLRIVFVLPKL